jgi:redox-sensitive bicupin YhaK (pirin superfamily)
MAEIVELVIETRARDLVEGFKVRRVLPSRQRRMVGPFIFLDQMGPEILTRRNIWWNFVSSSHERIEQAKEDWREGRFAPVPNENEFIPLPESGPVVVRYP